MNHQYFPIRGRTIDYETVNWRLGQSFDHVAKFSSHLVDQATRQASECGGDARQIRKIHQVFQRNLLHLKDASSKDLRSHIQGKQMSPEEKKGVKGLMKKVASDEAELLKKLQLDLLVDLSHINHPDEPWSERLFEWQVNKLASGGRITRFFAWLTSTRSTLKAYHAAKETLNIASQKSFAIDPQTEVEEDIKQMFEENPVAELARRTGVVGLRGIYRIQAAYSKKKIKKQLKSFQAHRFSAMKRTLLQQKIDGTHLFLTPLNDQFDAQVNFEAYKPIVGTGGISSMNRMERHLINAYRMQLSDDEGVFLDGFRHAILAEKKPANSDTRLKTSRKMAQELLMAPVLADYHERGLTPKTDGEGKGPKVHVVSISLVTPDAVRPALNALGIHQADERRMLQDQVSGLKSYNGCKFLPVSDEKEVRTDLSVSAFNFGTNVGAVEYGRLIGANQTQYTINKKGVEELDLMVDDFINVCDNLKPPSYEGIIQKESTIKTVKQMRKDITNLMQNPAAYLATGNQYEIQGRIILLMQTMDNLMKPLKADPAFKDIPGYKWCFNCMSDKDRSGIMAAVACAISTLYKKEGRYPSVERLMKEPDLAKRYVELILKYLRSVNLDITTLNTGAPGYKVKKEANIVANLRKKLKISKDHPIWGIDPRFPELTGLSFTTKA